MAPWAPHVLDNLMAPDLSALRTCGAGEVPQLPNYGGSLITNHVLSGIAYPDGVRSLVLNFMGRLGAAINEYNLGRAMLQDYVDSLPEPQRLSSHRKALAQFEGAVLQLHVSIVCLQGAGKILGLAVPWSQDENSEYARLRKINNRIKHFDEDVVAAVSGGKPVPLAPVWLTNEGLAASSARLTFAEMEAIMRDQTVDAKAFGEDFPRAIAERRRAEGENKG